MHKQKRGKSPKYFDGIFDITQINVTHTHDTRHRNTQQPTRTNRETTNNTIRYFIPKLSAELDETLKVKMATHSLVSFKNSLKMMYLDSYQIQCTKPHCYVCSHWFITFTTFNESIIVFLIFVLSYFSQKQSPQSQRGQLFSTLVMFIFHFHPLPRPFISFISLKLNLLEKRPFYHCFLSRWVHKQLNLCNFMWKLCKQNLRIKFSLLIKGWCHNNRYLCASLISPVYTNNHII